MTGTQGDKCYMVDHWSLLFEANIFLFAPIKVYRMEFNKISMIKNRSTLPQTNNKELKHAEATQAWSVLLINDFIAYKGQQEK